MLNIRIPTSNDKHDGTVLPPCPACPELRPGAAGGLHRGGLGGQAAFLVLWSSRQSSSPEPTLPVGCAVNPAPGRASLPWRGPISFTRRSFHCTEPKRRLLYLSPPPPPHPHPKLQIWENTGGMGDGKRVKNLLRSPAPRLDLQTRSERRAGSGGPAASRCNE